MSWREPRRADSTTNWIETLEEMEFTSKVHGVCAPLYSSGEKGRPPIDPGGVTQDADGLAP